MDDKARITALEQKLDQLAAQNEKLLTMLTGPRESRGPEGGAAVVAQPALAVESGTVAMDRRNALRRLGTAAAATVGLVAANGAVNPARAADGDNVVVGGSYSGTETEFTYSGGSNSTAVGAIEGFNSNGAGVYGNTSTGAGVRGFAGGATGIGVVGAASSSAQEGVQGSHSDDGTGVRGFTSGTGGTGVLGEATGDSSTLGYGVRGVTGNTDVSDGAGVAGFADSGGIGIWGRSSDGYGVKGHADADGGIGVYAEGGDSLSVRGTGVYAVSKFGPSLQLSSASITVPPTSGSWTAGQFIVRSGHVWYCTASGTGTASTWVRLSSTFIPLDTPDRVYDSRDGGGRISRGETRDIDMTATASIPATASAVLVNLTAAFTNAAGYLTLYPKGATQPDTSSINYASGDVIANNATVKLTTGSLTVLCDGGPATNNTHFILDAYGYYA